MRNAMSGEPNHTYSGIASEERAGRTARPSGGSTPELIRGRNGRERKPTKPQAWCAAPKQPRDYYSYAATTIISVAKCACE